MGQGSQPQYRVAVHKDVPFQTRDGVTLRADVYRPDAEGRFPVLLTRLPYDKNGRQRDAIDYFVERGYVMVGQDTRGRFASDGDEYYPLIWEAQDGYDAVEWAAGLPWSDGNVGTIGQSYLGATQYLLAANPTAAPESGVPDFRLRRLSPELGLPHRRRLRIRLADPVCHSHGARLHRPARPDRIPAAGT